MKPATEILLSAAFVLTPMENWFGKSSRREPGSLCAYLAITKATEALELSGFACDAVKYFESVAGGDIVDFNDNHTHPQVLRALYKAAELSEES